MKIKDSPIMEEVILKTAEKLFLEKGYALTSTTEIAKEVGCNQALIHYYFRTKDNLFNTIFEQKFRIFFKKIFEMENYDYLSFTDTLKQIIESHFEMIQANPRIPLLIINELSRKPEQVINIKEKLKEIPEKLLLRLNTQLQAEIEAGRIRDTNLMDIVFNMVSLNVSLFLLMPIMENAFSINESQKKILIEHRKTEHVDFILKSLRL